MAFLSIINSLSLVTTNEERAHFNQRLHLDAVGGGGGLASAESLAEIAYIGSMALTACHAVKFLPPGTSLSAAFPEAKKLLDNGILREVDSIKDVTLADIANDAVPKVQRLLTLQRRAARITGALAAAASPQDRANLLSQATAEASAFLTVVPGGVGCSTKNVAITVSAIPRACAGRATTRNFNRRWRTKAARRARAARGFRSRRGRRAKAGRLRRK